MLQLIQRDRQIADADARCMIDGVGDGGGGANDPDFADALRAHWIEVRVVLVNPRHVNRADIGVGRDVILREVTEIRAKIGQSRNGQKREKRLPASLSS